MPHNQSININTNLTWAPVSTRVAPNYRNMTVPYYRLNNTSSTNNVQQKVSQNEQFFIDKYGKAVVDKAKEVAMSINCDWIDLIEIMYSESGMDPKKHHERNGKIVGAVGLIQFTQVTIDQINKTYPELNLTKEKLIKMSTVEQLSYVQKYYEISKKIAGFRDNHKLSELELYALTFMPKYAKNDVLAKSGNFAYDENKDLDKNNDGKITKSDLQIHINNRLTELYGKRLNLHA